MGHAATVESSARAWEAAITIGQLGEFGLIAAITKALGGGTSGQADDVILGAGDDAAVLRVPDGRVVATTDMLIEGRHFRTDWSSATDIGHKAAARNLADVAAMGARPTALLVGFAGPAHLSVDWVIALAEGIGKECAAAGAMVIGGDTSSAETILLAITALGELGGRDPVTRAGAKPGDVVAVAGTLGSAAAGLDLLMAGSSQPRSIAESTPAIGGAGSSQPRSIAESTPGIGGAGSSQPRSIAESTPEDGGELRNQSGRSGQRGEPGASDGAGRPGESGRSGQFGLADLVGAHRRPHPPYPAGPEAAALGATAMIDVSDGLIADVGHVAEASGVRIELSSALLSAENVARVGALQQAAQALGKPAWLPWVLTGGDDHALVATFRAKTELPDRWIVIGLVTEGTGVAVDDRTWTGAGGWEHFR